MGARNNEYHYETVVEAINELRRKGYTHDFNLEENCLICGAGQFTHEEFDVEEVYRYEGMSDPGDEATVYGIASKTGVKGILVTGNASEIDSRSEAILRKLHY
ncbi:MAG: hypothetical protein ABS46_05185 [Cytophagaceae bacterium SCN 52-12]|nr:MAG: hypothetical protein ABS46_05185 [Cytophagaceae bacterium SCN 52-12]